MTPAREEAPWEAAGWSASAYGDRIAAVYDQWYGDHPDVEAAADAIAALAPGGRVLELGIGTGRLALPLAARGLEVHGVDASPEMVARLRAKPGGDAIPVTMADLAALPDVDVGGPFDVVLAVFNVLFNLVRREDQARCLAGAARVLAPGGALVLESFVPDDDRLAADPGLSVRGVEPDRVLLHASRVDVDQRRIDASIIDISEAGIRLYPVQVLYASPAELDDLAAGAGLALAERWGDWSGAPFTDESSFHVSIYRRSDHGE